MRVVPAPGLVLRDPRTKMLVDPELGVEIDAGDITFGWLLAQGDIVELAEDAYQAAQAERDAADQAGVDAALKAAAAAPPPPAKAPPAAPAPDAAQNKDVA
jgi:hypothetical protein